jgi:ketosteroid isomerase-like protein
VTLPFRLGAPGIQELIAVAHEWDRAMVTNDADLIGRYMTDDWVIIGSDGRSGDRASFLALIAAGVLTHDEMTSADFTVRSYDNAAVLTSTGISAGRYQGHPFREYEMASNLFVRQDGAWKCAHTHLSTLAPPE